MKNKNINVQTLKTDTETFFFTWIKILQPFLNLRKQEVEVLGKLLYHRYKIRCQIINPVDSFVDETLFGTAYRKKIKDELGLADYSFNNIISSLRKKKMLLGNSINKKIIPNLDKQATNFKLLYNFEIIQK